MEKTSNTNNVLLYIKKHWFQITIICFLLFVLVRKDFSFQFHMNNPENLEEPTSRPMDNKNKKQELITQKEAKKDEKPGMLEKFGLSFIGGGVASNKKSEYAKVDENTVQLYLKRFAHVAISEQKKYGVPSSITLANALFHSFAGTRDMAKNGHNHFAINCSMDWNGSNGNYQNKCYRHYENAWTSFRDHSLFVTTGKYADLVEIGSTNYKTWAKQLENKGYSEFIDLEKNLIEIIERYELHQLDYQ